jgi:site-specific DNA-methyltransferase (adenine-specific)
MKNAEYILFLRKGKAKKINNVSSKTVHKYKNGINKLHPSEKPIELMEYLINTYTNENETVLDFTMGSGSTMVACKNLNRNGIGIDNGYCTSEKTINNINLNGLSWVEITQLRLENKL